jgi:hypothetical protein
MGLLAQNMPEQITLPANLNAGGGVWPCEAQ